MAQNLRPCVQLWPVAGIANTAHANYAQSGSCDALLPGNPHSALKDEDCSNTRRRYPGGTVDRYAWVARMSLHGTMPTTISTSPPSYRKALKRLESIFCFPHKTSLMSIFSDTLCASIRSIATYMALDHPAITKYSTRGFRMPPRAPMWFC